MKSFAEIETIEFKLLPKEAVCVVQCLRMTIELLHQTRACYGESGDVILEELRQKLIDQVERQRA